MFADGGFFWGKRVDGRAVIEVRLSSRPTGADQFASQPAVCSRLKTHEERS